MPEVMLRECPFCGKAVYIEKKPLLCHADCENALGKDERCIFHMRFNKSYQCLAYDCMGNYEGSCLLDLYDDCGCRKYFEEGRK